MGYDEFYRYQRTREAKGGIKAQNRRGAFAESWWGRRWIQVLESFDIGERLSRGRGYARKGQVLDLKVAAGKVTAKVQGSRPSPYRVTIAMAPLSDAKWTAIGAALAEDAWSTARLAGGEMPETLEACFTAAGAPLFPQKLDDLRTECSCPDWSNPCKHVAAVYYLLAESFDRDPFLLFQLRGRDRAGFLALLGHGGGKGTSPAVPEETIPPQPLAADPRGFWQGQPVPPDLHGGLDLTASVPLAAALGPLAFWRGETGYVEAISALVTAAAPRGRQTVVGAAEEEPAEPADTRKRASPARR